MSDLLEVDLGTITRDIWAAMLGLELEPVHAAAAHPSDVRVVTGVVQIGGDWAGAVTVQTTERFATQAAAQLFAMEPDEVGSEEISDTIGELANVVGGNVKSALLGDLKLSLPTVTSGRDYQVAISGAEVREQLGFDCGSELIVVSLLQATA